MLSYQHSYHAAGLADLQKHMALTTILKAFVAEPKPILAFETHAGRGLYDLSGKEALKTGEAKLGLEALEALPLWQSSHPFAKLLKSVRKAFGDNAYPGSPLIARAILREQDKQVLCELHPQEYTALGGVFEGSGVDIIKADGFETVMSKIPEKQAPWQGFLLVDPSYELKEEYEKTADFLIGFHKAWPKAAGLLWYPILEPKRHEEMARRLRVANLPRFWQQEIFFKESSVKRAKGTGLIAFNLPEGVNREELEALQPLLSEV